MFVCASEHPSLSRCVPMARTSTSLHTSFSSFSMTSRYSTVNVLECLSSSTILVSTLLIIRQADLCKRGRGRGRGRERGKRNVVLLLILCHYSQGRGNVTCIWASRLTGCSLYPAKHSRMPMHILHCMHVLIKAHYMHVLIKAHYSHRSSLGPRLSKLHGITIDGL